MPWAFSKARAWTNTMSTSDPASAERSTPPDVQNSGGLTGDSLSGAMASLPDAAVIARLANEFFAALPANAAPTNVGASVPARATTGDAYAVSPDVLTLPHVQNPGIQNPNPQNSSIRTPGVQAPGTPADQQ